MPNQLPAFEQPERDRWRTVEAETLLRARAALRALRPFSQARTDLPDFARGYDFALDRALAALDGIATVTSESDSAQPSGKQ